MESDHALFREDLRRDVLNKIEDSDRDFIKLGNAAVHTGNVKRDVELYSGMNARRNVSVFRNRFGDFIKALDQQN